MEKLQSALREQEAMNTLVDGEMEDKNEDAFAMIYDLKAQGHRCYYRVRCRRQYATLYICCVCCNSFPNLVACSAWQLKVLRAEHVAQQAQEKVHVVNHL